eukprot:scaffold583_cov244-Ochromonas_danica.AAC.1
MSDAYKVVKGKLKFKGDSKKGPLVPKKTTDTTSRNNPSGHCEDIPVIDSLNQSIEEEVVVRNGSGRITTSGTTVHGHDTHFMNDLSVGDAIIIIHPTTLQEETKIVRMVLSNVSISISSPFSTDLISSTTFRYIKAPKDEVGEEEKTRQEVSRQHKTEESAFGTYASEGGTKFNYRVKKGGAFGGYKIISESTNNSMSREELLNMRSKKKSDRFAIAV